MAFSAKTKIILFFSIITILSSCVGQKAPEKNRQIHNNLNKDTRIGEPVSEMENGTMVIFQDSQNNYWFGGSVNCVYKYDVKNLTLFSIKDGLCSHSILGIQEDEFGNIYFDTTDGVSKFDGKVFMTLEVVGGEFFKNEWKLEPNDLWFRMGWNKNGPYRYDGKFLYHLEFPKMYQADVFYAKNPNASFTPYGIYSIYKDPKGSIWFGTSSLGACRYDGKTIKWIYERHLVETPGGGNPGIRSIIEDKDGYFWFSNTRYRYEFLVENSEKDEERRLNFRKENGLGYSDKNGEMNYPYYMSITEDNDGNLWIATYDDGVWREEGDKLSHYPVKAGENKALLFSIYKDNQGILWLATHNAEVYKFNGEAFEKFKP